jgi:hypothetical protein
MSKPEKDIISTGEVTPNVKSIQPNPKRSVSSLQPSSPKSAVYESENVEKVHVFKVGGAHLDDADYLKKLVKFIQASLDQHARVVLVHGGGKEIGQLHEALEIPFKKNSVYGLLRRRVWSL